MKWIKRPELIVSCSFLVGSLAWIIYSDAFFLHWQRHLSPDQITRLQTIKGCSYVTLVSFGLYFLIRQLNKRLYKSTESYKDVFYNSMAPLIIYQKSNGNIINANRAAVNTYGYTKAEFRTLNIDAIRRQSPLKEDKITGTVTHWRKDETIIMCLEKVSETTYKDEAAVLLSVSDVTRIEQAKEALIDREQEVMLMLNSITDGFFTLDENMCLIRFNQRFCDLVETDVQIEKGVKLTALFNDIDDSLTYRQFLEAMVTHQPIHFENYFRGRIWHRISAYPYSTGISVFFRDVTEEKLKEEKIHQNERNLLSVINNTEDLIWSIDKSFKYYTYNEPYERIYNHLFGEQIWIGKTALNERQGEYHVEKWKALYQRALDGEKFYVDMDFDVDGLMMSAIVRFNPIRDEDKRVIGATCFLQNITDRKRHERQIEQQNQQLRNIAFITSHKVRVPLANILGLVEIFDNTDLLNPLNAEVVEMLRTSAQQLDQFIKNMVDQTVKVE